MFYAFIHAVKFGEYSVAEAFLCRWSVISHSACALLLLLLLLLLGSRWRHQFTMAQRPLRLITDERI